MESLCEPKPIEENERKEEDKAKDKVGCFDMVGGFFNEFGHKIGEAFTFGIPTAELAGFQIPSIDFHKVEFLVELLLKNPNPIPIPLVDINYVVESDGKKLVSGSINDSGEIPAHGSDTIKVPVTLVYEDITKMSCEITPGSVIPYKIVVDLIIHIPIIGKLPIPFEMTGEIPIPKMPNVVLNDIRFDKFTFEETIAVLGLKLENTNEFVLGLMSLDFEVWLAGLNIGGAKLTENLSEVGEKGVSYIDVPFSFKPEDFGTALWDLISGEGTGYSLKGFVEVNTPLGAMKMPIFNEGDTTIKK